MLGARALSTILIALCAATGAPVARAQKGDAANAANNPLTPSITFNFHDYYVPDIIGLSDREANQYLQTTED
jgi:hypothetical protein